MYLCSKNRNSIIPSFTDDTNVAREVQELNALLSSS